jgi:hypothetical protein
MSILADSDLERLAYLLERGKMKHALEIARLLRMERADEAQTTLALDDPLSRYLSACIRSWGGQF